jgi:hypothetical protein
MSFGWVNPGFDFNGNSRVACHWSKIGLATETYSQAVKRASRLGGRKYNTKACPDSIVFQRGHLISLEDRIKEERLKDSFMFVMLEDTVVCLMLDIDEHVGYCMSYSHIGQHGMASLDLLNKCRRATNTEANDLYYELIGLGYNIP